MSEDVEPGDAVEREGREPDQPDGSPDDANAPASELPTLVRDVAEETVGVDNDVRPAAVANQPHEHPRSVDAGGTGSGDDGVGESVARELARIQRLRIATWAVAVAVLALPIVCFSLFPPSDVFGTSATNRLLATAGTVPDRSPVASSSYPGDRDSLTEPTDSSNPTGPTTPTDPAGPVDPPSPGATSTTFQEGGGNQVTTSTSVQERGGNQVTTSTTVQERSGNQVTTSTTVQRPDSTAIPGGRVPAAPTNAAVVAIDPFSTRITWRDNSDNEAQFEVNNGDESRFVGANVTTYVWSGQSPGNYMCIHVRAVNSAGSSDWSPATSPYYVCTTTPGAAPAAPTNAAVVAIDPFSTRITWRDNSDNEAQFEVNNGDESRFVGANVTTYVWSGQSPGNYMCIHVRAVNSAGSSDWSPATSPYYVCTTTPTA